MIDLISDVAFVLGVSSLAMVGYLASPQFKTRFKWAMRVRAKVIYEEYCFDIWQTEGKL
jgi:hypothetical protein